MKPVTIYGNATCPYCGAARMLLTRRGIPFTDIDVSGDPELLAEMKQRSNGSTVPQIFVGETPIGGFDELDALDRSGELDNILAA
ncbi:MAG: glutaredoxin 3 [Woeseiaceae bacterium]